MDDKSSLSTNLELGAFIIENIHTKRICSKTIMYLTNKKQLVVIKDINCSTTVPQKF